MTAPGPPKAVGTGEPERDAWLREALRHAPDSGLAAPAALSEAILREAREAARTSAPGQDVAAGSDRAASVQRPQATAARPLVHRLVSGPGRRLIDAWDALARPSVAAGLASVVAVVLVGLLWWDRPLEDGLPRAERAPKSAARESVDPRPVPAAEPGSVEPSMDTEPPRERRQADASKVAPAPAPPIRGRLASTPPAPAPPQDLSTQSGADAPADQAMANRMQRSPSAQPLPFAQPSPSTPPPSSTPDIEPHRRSADRSVPSAPEGSLPVTPGAAPTARGAAAASPLGALRAAVDAAPDRWSWARDGGRRRPVDTAVQGWLARLEAASAAPAFGAAGLTNSRSEAGRSDAAVPADADAAASLYLFRDGQPVATLRLGTALELAIDPAAGAEQGLQPWRAPLSTDRARALRADMP